MQEGMFLDRQRVHCSAPPETVFDVVCGLGGDSGWPAANFLWQVRGSIDWMLGGVGMRRAVGQPSRLHLGDPLDFWRVEGYEPPHLLRLRAEMKLPGTAWLQFEIHPDSDGTWIEQTAIFDPRGKAGYTYWYILGPFHRRIFPGLVRAIRDRAEAGSPTSRPPAAQGCRPARTPPTPSRRRTAPVPASPGASAEASTGASTERDR